MDVRKPRRLIQIEFDQRVDLGANRGSKANHRGQSGDCMWTAAPTGRGGGPIAKLAAHSVATQADFASDPPFVARRLFDA